MRQCYRSTNGLFGTVRSVGVCNFSLDLLDGARDVLDVPLAVHQVEFHPLLCQRQRDLLEFAREHDHVLVAYSPVAWGAVFDVPEITAVAEKHNATPSTYTRTSRPQTSIWTNPTSLVSTPSIARNGLSTRLLAPGTGDQSPSSWVNTNFPMRSRSAIRSKAVAYSVSG